VDLCKPGDRVAIVGMYKAIPVSTQGSTSGIFKTLIVATNVRQLTAEVTQPTFSQEDMKNIRRMIKRKDLFEVSTLRTLPPAHRSLPLGVVWSKTRIIRISNPGTPPLHPFLHNQRRRSHLTDAPCRRGGVHTTAAPVAKPSSTRGWSDRYHTVHLFNTAEWECVGSGDRGLAGAVHLRARADQAGAHLAAAGWTREEPRQRDASTRRHQREQPTASSQQLHSLTPHGPSGGVCVRHSSSFTVLRNGVFWSTVSLCFPTRFDSRVPPHRSTRGITSSHSRRC
jgi:hypothetical protein